MGFFEIKTLSYKYENQWVFKDITFDAKEGELIAIVGPSGCGKTTLLRIIVGILDPHEGSVVLDNMSITRKAIEKRKIGYVPQNQGLFPHLSVYDNISFGLIAQKWPKEKIIGRVNELAEIGGIKEFLNRRPHELSGGQQQRVALLRALAPFPKLLLLDEPLSNIDAQLREQLAIYIRNIQQMSCITTLFVTHDLDEAKMLADKLIIIDQGRMLQIGSPKEICTKPITIEAAKTLGIKNLYNIKSISQDENVNKIIVDTDIGTLLINNTRNNNDEVANSKAVYIDPTEILITKENETDLSGFSGIIISIIPKPMIHQSTILIKVIHTIPINDKNYMTNNIVRAQIPIENDSFQISDKVAIKIPEKALRFYQ